MLGIPLLDGPDKYANSVIGIAPGVAQQYRYDKHHLVPFGEFIPTGFRWFTNMMQIPLGDFQRGGAVQAAFAVKDQRVLPNICYEDLFGDEIANMLRESPAPATICSCRRCAPWRRAAPCCAPPIMALPPSSTPRAQ